METAISGKIFLYNTFAELCQYIINTQTKNYLVRYGCISPEEKARIEGLIKNEKLIPLDPSGTFLPMKESDITNDFLIRLMHFSSLLRKNDDENCIMRLLQILDLAMEDLLKDEIRNLETQDATYELNTNRDTTGIELLPRCSCVWARKSRQSFSYRRIDNYLNHIIVIENRVLRGISDEHHFIPKGFFPGFDKTGQFRVSATPLSKNPNFDTKFHRNGDLQVFSLEYHESDSDKENRLVWEKIVEAGACGSEIVVFPEMLGNASMEKAIRRKLQALSPEERKSIPPMIILPTYFIDGHNCAVVLDRNGRRMASQYKHNPYVMREHHNEYMEDIHGSNVVEIFHYEGIGRFAILICKDFLTTRYMERIMRGCQLTLIVVPAYSTGSYDFKMSFDLCAHDYCNVVWINSCAAMKPGKEDNFRIIGYVRKRVGRNQDPEDSMYEMRPCENLLHGTCKKNCLYTSQFGRI